MEDDPDAEPGAYLEAGDAEEYDPEAYDPEIPPEVEGEDGEEAGFGEDAEPPPEFSEELAGLSRAELIMRCKAAVKVGAPPLLGRGRDPAKYEDDELRMYLTDPELFNQAQAQEHSHVAGGSRQAPWSALGGGGKAPRPWSAFGGGGKTSLQIEAEQQATAVLADISNAIAEQAGLVGDDGAEGSLISRLSD